MSQKSSNDSIQSKLDDLEKKQKEIEEKLAKPTLANNILSQTSSITDDSDIRSQLQKLQASHDKLELQVNTSSKLKPTTEMERKFNELSTARINN